MQGRAGGTGLPLSFNGPLLIVGGGRVDAQLLKTLAARAAGCVGADSGGEVLLAAGIVPDAVIGDMDSTQAGKFSSQTRVIDIAEQDTTDFEKCLYSTRAPVTLALGMTGGRFDHTLAALHAVARHAAQRSIVLIDENDLALGVAGGFAINVGEGARVSIYPLGRTQFARSEGLLYQLEGLVMEQGKVIGTSNRAIADRVEINVAGGAQDPWLLILDKEQLPEVLDQITGRMTES